MPAVPIACNLSPENFSQRKQLLWKLTDRSAHVREVASGYEVTFSPGSVALVELASLVEFERRCCPFLRFTIIAEPDQGPVRLELSGPAAAKDLLRALLKLA